MNRFYALILALLFATVTVSSACVAAPSDWVHFTLEPERGNPAKVHASFRDETRDRYENSWSSGFMPSDLIGLDISGFRSSGTRPLRFAIVREAGRLDCAGHGGEGYAGGNCSFTPDPRFEQLLVSRGIGRPTREQAFGLMAVNVRREMIDAVAAARYPTPTIDDLMALTAVGVTGPYIQGMARAGYRPPAIHSLIEFRALGITPEWVSGFSRIGYANIPSNELLQLKAMGITPDFIAGFQRIGYRHVEPTTLVQLKALNITPEFVQRAAGTRDTMPSVSELMEIRMFGRKR